MYGPASISSSSATRRDGSSSTYYGDAAPQINHQQNKRRNTVPLELGAVLNTVCIKCGLTGHLSSECYFRTGEKRYELVTDYDEIESAAAATVEVAKSSSFSPSSLITHPVGRGRGAVVPSWMLGQGSECIVGSIRSGSSNSSNSSSSSSSSRSGGYIPQQDSTSMGDNRGSVGRGRGTVLPAWMKMPHADDVRFSGRSGESHVSKNEGNERDHDDNKEQKKKHKHKERKEHKEHKEHKHKDRKEKKKKDHKKEKKSKKSSKQKSKKRSLDDGGGDDDDGYQHKEKRHRASHSSSSSDSSSDDSG